jgi:predicted GNAT family acetyltransferase
MNDLDEIKAIADKNKAELGFIIRGALAESLSRRCIFVAKTKDSKRIVGFAHYRMRKDGVTKIYQLCVMHSQKRQHVGHGLLKAIGKESLESGQDCLLLKCPEDLPANGFYRRMGFNHVGSQQGRLRKLHIWRLDFQSRFTT